MVSITSIMAIGGSLKNSQDGIMSAIDFDMSVTKVESPKGDRVKVEMSGKYLAYNAW